MGDWIKDNMFTANFISTIVLIAIFSFVLGKPYVDKMDEKNKDEIEAVTDTITIQLNHIITGNDSINANLKRIWETRSGVTSTESSID